MVPGHIKESLMEMDQTEVEIRWGNCKKTADVLTGDGGGRRMAAKKFL